MFMSELTIQFGQLVRKYRKEKSMPQEHLALLCNMDRSYLGRIERGEVNPTLEKLYELAKSLGVNVKDLLPE
ncbi:helix-turn-helix transcriptional regulator [Acinetobacter sp. MD2]|uniref:helix-turn-helix domain-containing protein n=1 Tax=Acinetobacter sp. MD2 TaxID=2600066 RepID=UPI002D1E7CB3|nr:helix-turn-helix transcriptional regulator [Acinetobacter sp. MD2]MEB3768292.1 helix-turn-helix transcriptional regulator [Acinetobacter sp. MD2]